MSSSTSDRKRQRQTRGTKPTHSDDKTEHKNETKQISPDSKSTTPKAPLLEERVSALEDKIKLLGGDAAKKAAKEKTYRLCVHNNNNNNDNQDSKDANNDRNQDWTIGHGFLTIARNSQDQACLWFCTAAHVVVEAADALCRRRESLYICRNCSPWWREKTPPAFSHSSSSSSVVDRREIPSSSSSCLFYVSESYVRSSFDDVGWILLGAAGHKSSSPDDNAAVVTSFSDCELGDVLLGTSNVFVEGTVVHFRNRRALLNGFSAGGSSGCPLFNRHGALSSILHGETKQKNLRRTSSDDVDPASISGRVYVDDAKALWQPMVLCNPIVETLVLLEDEVISDNFSKILNMKVSDLVLQAKHQEQEGKVIAAAAAAASSSCWCSEEERARYRSLFAPFLGSEGDNNKNHQQQQPQGSTNTKNATTTTLRDIVDAAIERSGQLWIPSPM